MKYPKKIKNNFLIREILGNYYPFPFFKRFWQNEQNTEKFSYSGH